jgi:hypothetical protein
MNEQWRTRFENSLHAPGPECVDQGFFAACGIHHSQFFQSDCALDAGPASS